MCCPRQDRYEPFALFRNIDPLGKPGVYPRVASRVQRFPLPVFGGGKNVLEQRRNRVTIWSNDPILPLINSVRPAIFPGSGGN